MAEATLGHGVTLNETASHETICARVALADRDTHWNCGDTAAGRSAMCAPKRQQGDHLGVVLP